MKLKYIGSKIKEKTALQLDIYVESMKQEHIEEERYEEVEINISNAFFASSQVTNICQDIYLTLNKYSSYQYMTNLHGKSYNS